MGTQCVGTIFSPYIICSEEVLFCFLDTFKKLLKRRCFFFIVTINKITFNSAGSLHLGEFVQITMCLGNLT